MIEYIINVKDYQIKFRDVYVDVEKQIIKKGGFSLIKEVSIDFMKDFLQRVLVHAPNIDVDFDEIVLKEKFLGKKTYKGFLKGIDKNGKILLETENHKIKFNFLEIEKANIDPNWAIKNN